MNGKPTNRVPVSKVKDSRIFSSTEKKTKGLNLNKRGGIRL